MQVRKTCDQQIVTCGEQSHVVATCHWEDYRRHIIACVNACHRLGLTAEQLNAGVLDELIAAAKDVVEPSPLGPKVTWDKDGSPIIDAHDSCEEFLKNWHRLESALRPFTKESRDEKAKE